MRLCGCRKQGSFRAGGAQDMAGGAGIKSLLNSWQVVSAPEEDRPLEEIAAELGPFSPPHYQFEPEFLPPAPRPIPATLRKGPYARRFRRLIVTMLCMGLVCLACARLSLVRELANYILPLAYLHWVAYGLFAIAAIGIIRYLATGNQFRYVRDGVPLVVRVLCRKYEILQGQSPHFRFLAGVDCLDPETGALTRTWMRSDAFPSRSADLSRYQPPYEVGDYVTAVYLPGKFQKTACIYSLMGLNPSVGGILKDGRPWWPGLSTFAVLCILIGFVGLFALLVVFIYAVHFFEPIEMGAWDFWKWSLPAGLLMGALGGFGLFWLNRRNQRRSGISNRKRLLLAGFCGIVLGFAAGVTKVTFVNAALDSSPARYRDVEIVNVWRTTHHFIVRIYEIEYAELGSGRKAKCPARPEYINEFQMGVGVLDVRTGFLGVPWVRQIYPVVLREVKNPSDHPKVLAIPQQDSRPGEEKFGYFVLAVALENGKTLPASEAIWDLVRRQNKW
jgi:hypothetical protein